MDSITVTLEELGGAINVICKDYIDEVEQQVREDVDAAAEVVESQLRATSPRSSASRRHYADGWTTDDDSDGLRGYGVRIYNKAKPGLTHLLEKGHGGPHPAGAHPHIAAAAQAGIDELNRRIT